MPALSTFLFCSGSVQHGVHPSKGKSASLLFVTSASLNTSQGVVRTLNAHGGDPISDQAEALEQCKGDLSLREPLSLHLDLLPGC